jgi:phenylacetate-CoA ligase
MLHDLLAINVLVPAWDHIRGGRLARYRARARAEARAVLDADLPTIREYQLQRIRSICQHAYNTTSFYRDRFDRIGLRKPEQLTWDEFAQVPILTKVELREQVGALVSDNFQLPELRQSATGGTTSSPTPIYMDWECNARRWAASEEWDRRIGYRRGQRIACLWGASQDWEACPSLQRKVLDHFVSRSLFMPASPLDEATMSRYYKALKRWKPVFLQAYPTPLAIFADYLVENNLSLAIPAISVTAEPLLPVHRDKISTAFGTVPYNWYGAREAGRIATECKRHQGMHINAYGLHVEIGSLGHYADPSIGSVVVTDLWNMGMPIIRYQIGDLGSMTEETCSCGSRLPRVTNLYGRTSDVLINSRGQRILGVAVSSRFKRDASEFCDMQLTQTAVGEFEVLIVPAENWRGSASEQRITEQICEFMQEHTQATFSLVDSIPREPSGKVRFCKSMLTDPV